VKLGDIGRDVFTGHSWNCEGCDECVSEVRKCPECGEPYREEAFGRACTHLSDCQLPWQRFKDPDGVGDVGKKKKEEVQYAEPTVDELLDSVGTEVALWREAEETALHHATEYARLQEEAAQHRAAAIRDTATLGDILARRVRP
jgi:hypothetical protein